MNLDGVYEGECTSGDEEVGCDWGEVVVCTVEGELGGWDCGREGYIGVWGGDNVDWVRYVRQCVVIE